jgi:murein DD-endopeptidase MepM/ murein hydrolase activator NlpD
LSKPQQIPDVVMPVTRHRGHSFLRFRRRYLALGAMAFAGAMTCLPTLPASADAVHSEAIVPGQVLATVATGVEVQTVERAEFAISYYSVVGSPVAPGSRLGKVFSGGHQGFDFLPGANTPVLSIADGVVIAATNSDGSLGVHVEIEHVIDGEVVVSTYSHMAAGSLGLSVGDTVTRGQQVGLVGSTGASTGPHLHFQIILGGTPVDPLAWLNTHVNA